MSRANTGSSRRVVGTYAVAALLSGVCGGLLLSVAPAYAQPPMGGRPDPRQMSGLSRLDPQVAPGTVTVRCLLGGFDQPAVGAEVTLEVRSTDGRVETFTEKADGEGRATFTGVEGFVGGQALASVDFDGELVRSREIPIAASAGSRVMLVKGAAAVAAGPAAGPAGGPAGAPAAGAPGPGEVDGAGFPAPGRPFSDPRFPKGTLVVGVLDLKARDGVKDIDVRLVIRPPEGEEIVRTGTTDPQGRTLFDKLDADDVPEGSVLQVTAAIDEGAAPQVSEEFTIGEEGLALVFTIGQVSAEPGAAPAPVRRRAVMPPRLTPTMKAGSVRLSVIDAADQPVAQQEVELVQLDVTGAQVGYEGVSGPDGVAHFEGIKVNLDSAYQITVNYDGAPYSTSLFRLHESMGALAEIRVFKTTTDVSRIRSATQLEIAGRENDLAQVTQLYQVFVSGDEAYWPGAPLKIEGGEDAIGFVVMDRASAIVEHAEKSPFATLREPIPPGEVVDLSFAYLVEHTGTATVRWTPSLPLLESGALLPKELTLSSGSTRPPRPPDQAPDAPFDYYELGAREAGVPIELVVEGLPTRPRIFRDLGFGLGLGILGILGISLLTSPRRSRRDRLVERKQELLAALAADGAGASALDEEKRMSLAIELDQVIRQLDALDGATSQDAPAADSAKKDEVAAAGEASAAEDDAAGPKA